MLKLNSEFSHVWMCVWTQEAIVTEWYQSHLNTSYLFSECEIVHLSSKRVYMRPLISLMLYNCSNSMCLELPRDTTKKGVIRLTSLRLWHSHPTHFLVIRNRNREQRKTAAGYLCVVETEKVQYLSLCRIIAERGHMECSMVVLVSSASHYIHKSVSKRTNPVFDKNEKVQHIFSVVG